MKGRESYAAYVEEPRGDNLFNPMTFEEIRDKFRANLAFAGTLPDTAAEEALATLETLEKVKGIAEVIKVLA